VIDRGEILGLKNVKYAREKLSIVMIAKKKFLGLQNKEYKEII
jgi:hypothetical protein